jgi:circadian clock protein KaiC
VLETSVERTDTVLHFRYFEARGGILSALRVFKKRTGPHEQALRQLKISARCLLVGDHLREFLGPRIWARQYHGNSELLRGGEANR